MKLKIFTILTLISILAQLGVQTVQAQSADFQSEQIMVIEAAEIDPRIIILEDYLAKHKAPMQGSGKDFVEAADLYDLDWRLVVSIAGNESNFGKRVPGGNGAYTSFNGWGWGVYGTNVLYFDSWKDGIYTVSKGLKEDYVSRGLITPYQMNKRYASSKTWGAHVDFFMKDIERFAQNYPQDVDLAEVDSSVQAETVRPSNLPDTVGLSTKLANSSHPYRLTFVQ